MPVEFQTDEQAEAHGKFAEEPTRPELERFFCLDAVDCALRVLLPGVNVLARQVAEVRGIAGQRLYATVANAARRADASLPGEIDSKLVPPAWRRAVFNNEDTLAGRSLEDQLAALSLVLNAAALWTTPSRWTVAGSRSGRWGPHVAGGRRRCSDPGS